MTPFLKKIIGAASDGGLILTSNRRLSRHLHAAFDRQMQVLGERVWSTPQILSLDAWLDRLIAELDDSWRLLQGPPLKRLWEQIIEADSAGSEKELLQLSATAEKSRQAAQLVHEYAVSFDQLPLTEDQQAFDRWLERYQQLCAGQGWLDRETLSDQVLQALKSQKLPCPQHVLLTGFDQKSPLLSRLSAQFETSGAVVEEVTLELTTHNLARLYACHDSLDEIQQAASWTRKLLEQGADSIGIVVTDLQARRSQIERVLRNQIDPQAVLNLNAADSAFSLSLGAPLIEQGPIHAALEILTLGYRVSLDQLSFLLRTPYLKSSIVEADSRAIFDSRLRSFRQQSFRLTRSAAMAKTDNLAPEFGGCLALLARELKDAGRSMPGEWASRFDAILTQVGWPGEHSLSSSEYQMIKAWRDKLLPALASLDAVSPPVERSQALSWLRRLAAEIEFQLESPDGPVQVVGLLESAGLEFDHLWVMGMSEAALPAPARPNPFIPVSLQTAHQMPHASAERELDFARRVVTRLQAASPATIFSYPSRDGDCDLRPSPLIQNLPPAEPVFAASADLCSQMVSQATALDEISDTQGPSLGTERGAGGTSILKDQALCPFRAFALHRLHAYAFEQAQLGLDAMTRGNLLHKALELFWRGVKDQQQLNQLDDAARNQTIRGAVSQAMTEYFTDRPDPQSGLLEIEQPRLVALIDEWLTQIEQVRPVFKTVQLEKEHLLRIGPLEIRTVIDRIDRLDGERLVVLDYKTGAVEAELLIGERLLEPQLPIYAITNSASEADGVAFAQVRRGSCKLIGVSRASGLLPKVGSVEKNKRAQQLNLNSWDDLLQHWRGQLETVAEDFVSGVARVDPVDYKHACQYCELPGLCRIAETEMSGGQA